MKKIIPFILIIIFFSCNRKENVQEQVSSISPTKIYLDKYNNKPKMDSLIEEVLSKGDTIAFSDLKEIYYLSIHKKDFLYYSLVMANNYKNYDGYHTAYEILSTDSINDKNKNNNKLANYYLLKAYEIDKNNDSKFDIEQRFDKKKPIPKSSEYWLEINK